MRGHGYAERLRRDGDDRPRDGCGSHRSRCPDSHHRGIWMLRRLEGESETSLYREYTTSILMQKKIKGFILNRPNYR